jgi:MFS family permease
VILAVLSLAGAVYAVLSSAVIPALPTLQHDLNASETKVTWLLTGFLLSASVGTAIIGKLGDMYGKQRLLVWTLVLLSPGTLLAALSQSLPTLIVRASSRGWPAASSRWRSRSHEMNFRRTPPGTTPPVESLRRPVLPPAQPAAQLGRCAGNDTTC